MKHNEPQGCSETTLQPPYRYSSQGIYAAAARRCAELESNLRFAQEAAETQKRINRGLMDDAAAAERNHDNEVEALRALLKQSHADYQTALAERDEMRAALDSLTALGESLEAQLRELQADTTPRFTAPQFKAGYKVFCADHDAGSVLRAKVLLPMMEFHADAPVPEVLYRVRFDTNDEVTVVNESDVFGLIDEAVAALKGGE